MATYVEQVGFAPTKEKQLASIDGAVTYTLTSAADGVPLTGTGEALVIFSDESGWLHVSADSATDKAAATKTHRILSGGSRDLGGVRQGLWISFLAD